ncbi:rho guanine nucleotide exchange factor 26 [Nephila pilipes]|uniref:Rho guanine nucleotide exchange factor 26 n=1 Tax=Nephila pilipes TaxID=299642 RepID=A0A8X6M5L2_NEPPI|nr:rho guanine nucleotide exchange factor 26 [Nephila pilipes]
MPACTTLSSFSPVDSKKKTDYFQRRKVGSIRDNPKLLKIRQQFENACQENVKCQSTSKNIGGSAPCSFSLSKNSSTFVFDQLLKINTKFSDKTEAFLRNQLDTSQNRRNSEGDIKGNKSFSFAIYENSPRITQNDSKSNECVPSASVSLKSEKCTSFRADNEKRDDFNKKYEPQISSSESGIHTNSSASEEDSISSHSRSFGRSVVDESANKFFRSFQEDAPPIPRRGISPAVQNSFVHSRLNSNRKNKHVLADRESSTSSKKTNKVQNAIQIYEGMSSSDLKIKTTKTSLRRDDSTGRRSFILRRNSRRSSLRKSRHLNEKVDPSATVFEKKDVSLKDDSGVVLSDGEDRNQSIYQTLSATVNVSHTPFDPYDRLNRLHDAVNRIHKGQSSNCAACKAIPSSVLQLRTDDSSFKQVQCNELGPHHHPPCICFTCQHSIFSCSENSKLSSEAEENDDSLYYNVCCLNSPNRESWRQSRRRPVCEQNGRLCIVNCDMEKCPSNCSESKNTEESYAKLAECHSSSRSVPKDSMKHLSGDSCDSDEGWVDITDSEDEKTLIAGRRNNGSNPLSMCENSMQPAVMQNLAYDIDKIVLKCKELNLSRATSTEHLYESIADIEALTEENATKEQASHSSNNSVSGSVKGDQNPENDLDSGEWSTESASPTFDESANKHNIVQKSVTLNQFRFTVNSESPETPKKTFMKSVLGKKVVNQKKRRMSHFFVPWLVSNHEYDSTSKSHKNRLQKQNSRSQMTSPKSPCKNKRSQSIPTVSPKITISCTKSMLSSSDLLEQYRQKDGDLEDVSFLCPDGPSSVCSRSSIASSAYLRSDQLATTESVKTKSFVPTEATVDVIVEKVHKRSPSGSSEHTYIMFEPVKEEDVPLYQFYERNIKERVSFCRSPKSLSPVMWSSAPENSSMNDSGSKSVVPQLSVVEQLSPDAQDMKMLWCELPEVKESGILERISAQELKLQEAIFEFIQSQASYMRSLRVLHENFIRTPEFSDFESSSCVLSKHEHDVLFSDIMGIKEVTKRLMSEVSKRWNDGILIPDICDIIHRHAVLPSFSVYVKYCSNRVYQEKTLKELKEIRPCFLEVLRKLESNPTCQGLSLESFLFLPMQHISRLPLLLDNIFRWLVPDSPSFGICKAALESVHKIFVECNEGARKMERLEEMFALQKQLEFKECKVIPLISASRWLLKKGELMKLEFDKKTFGRSNRCIRVPIYIFLFNDLLIVTKRKNDDSYTVVDYCLREKVQAKAVNAQDLQQPVVVPNTCRYLLYLTLFNNHQGSSIDMILNCTLLSERTRWIEAIHNVPQNRPCEVWDYDCPQVQCVRSYIAQQPDELSLQESDVVTISRKMNDGWYEGRRLRDGLQGWFPASYTMDIPCSRARASNLRQCYRLLMLSQTQ